MTWRRWNFSDKKLVTVLTKEESIALNLRPCDNCGERWSKRGTSWVKNIAEGDERVRLSYSKIFHYVRQVDMLRPLEFELHTRCGRYFYVGPEK